jgi:hypothetical protein
MMAPRKKRLFDAKIFLKSAGLGKRVVSYARREIIFSLVILARTSCSCRAAGSNDFLLTVVVHE